MLNKTLVVQSMYAEFGIPVRYYMDGFNMNFLIGKQLKIQMLGFECLGCKLSIPIYSQGYCRECFFNVPETALWIMKPELSTAHLGIEDRDLEFEKKIQLQTHSVYIANASNIKVGMTRKTNLPTLWINQGVHEAIVVLEVPNRFLAGRAELALKNHFSDKSSWKAMLQGRGDKNLDMGLYYDKCVDIITSNDDLKDLLGPYLLERSNALENCLILNFPINHSRIRRVAALSLVRTKVYSGTLTGIRGQYLIFDDNAVLNIRSHAGVVLNFATV